MTNLQMTGVVGGGIWLCVLILILVRNENTEANWWYWAGVFVWPLTITLIFLVAGLSSVWEYLDDLLDLSVPEDWE